MDLAGLAQTRPAKRRRGELSRGVLLSQVYPENDETDTDIDIIAIHGLDTRSPDTWTWVDCSRPEIRVNWLQDPKMLPRKVERARIFTCDWPADLLQPSYLVQETVGELALLLFDGIQRRPPATGDHARREDRPILFIASCLGGIILMKALVDTGETYHSVRRATRGILFLATPFRGTSFQEVAVWVEKVLKAGASIQGQQVSNLLDSVKGSTFDLEALVRKFTHLSRHKDPPCLLFNFYELGKTSLRRKVFPLLPNCLADDKLLVDRSSATLDIVQDPLSLSRPHVLMNKFVGPECTDYNSVAGQIQKMLKEIREGSPLEQADTWIRDKNYNADRLKIERLSGDLLSMDQCYINLAIVEQPGQDVGRSKEGDVTPSPFSLFARQKVETPDKTIQVELPTLFSQRVGRDGCTIQPRRILIRGRAGVGKTTLCKKMVYDFTRNTQTKLHRSWTELFDRLLWVPLRNLKGRSTPGYNLEELFYHEYFSGQGHDDGRCLARELCRILKDTHSSRTLFVLDGLDEVSELLDPDSKMSNFLWDLLDQPNVIITSRPNASLPAIRDLDLELETIGFYPDQVKVYLDVDPKIKPRANEVQSFLQEHWLIQGLVRIPIQLDALCYTWEDFDSVTQPDTMPGIYKAIEQKLWKKDVLRLEKKHDGERVTRSQIGIADVEGLVKHEIYFLEGLAFTGLHNNIIDFTSQHRGAISKQFKHQDILLDKTLPRLSFLRTSDTSSEGRNRNYYFIHLTFQEYFAARYFVQQWTSGEQLPVLKLGSRQERSSITKIDAKEYLRKEKYNARYDIFWRFVAGLLHANHDEEHLCSFFRTIEDQPRDLLGPVHQRLVMHCLSEVVPSQEIPEFIKRLQEQLKRWLLFEWTFCGGSQLATEMEFPDQILEAGLREESEDVFSRAVLDVFRHRRKALSEQALQALVALLKDPDSGVRSAAAWALGGQSALSEQALQALVALLKDPDSRVRSAAAWALRERSALSEQALQALVALLKDPDPGVRGNAAEALRLLSALPDERFYSFLLTMDSQSFNDLYGVWLRRSFSDHLIWYVEGKNGRINMPEGGRDVPFDQLKSAVQKAQVSLKVPKGSFP